MLLFFLEHKILFQRLLSNDLYFRYIILVLLDTSFSAVVIREGRTLKETSPTFSELLPTLFCLIFRSGNPDYFKSS